VVQECDAEIKSLPKMRPRRSINKVTVPHDASATPISGGGGGGAVADPDR
jgi:hypothetical protein